MAPRSGGGVGRGCVPELWVRAGLLPDRKGRCVRAVRTGNVEEAIVAPLQCILLHAPLILVNQKSLCKNDLLLSERGRVPRGGAPPAPETLRAPAAPRTSRRPAAGVDPGRFRGHVR